MATTEENLKEAFAGESQAYRKYVAFAKKAEQEGFANVAHCSAQQRKPRQSTLWVI